MLDPLRASAKGFWPRARVLPIPALPLMSCVGPRASYSPPLCLSFPTLNKRSREDLPPCVWPLAAPSTQIPHFTKKGSQPVSEGLEGK